MMYSEFVNGTGCKQTAHNYAIFQHLEIMYMNSDLTKQEIYEYGKKLVDNRKTDEEIEFERQTKERIKELQEQVLVATESARQAEAFAKQEPDKFWKMRYKGEAEQHRNTARKARNEMRMLKTLIA